MKKRTVFYSPLGGLKADLIAFQTISIRPLCVQVVHGVKKSRRRSSFGEGLRAVMEEALEQRDRSTSCLDTLVVLLGCSGAEIGVTSGKSGRERFPGDLPSSEVSRTSTVCSL